MTQEDRSLNPGEILQGIGEMLDGDGVGDLPEAIAQGPYGTPGYPYGGAPAATYGAAPEQVPWQWQQAPYAPPFNLETGGTYPQMYQIPWSQFPDFPYRPEEFAQVENDGEGAASEEERQMPMGGYGGYPYHPYYHRPRPRPYYHHYYHPRPHGYGGYPYGGGYGGQYPHRQEGTDENQQEQREVTETGVANQEDSRFFPGFGFGGFPGFGFGGFPGFGFGGFPGFGFGGFGFPGFGFGRPFFHRPFFHRPWW
jgi:hypothetical protein